MAVRSVPHPPRYAAAGGAAATVAALVALALIWPHDAWEGFFNNGYLSKFARSGVNRSPTSRSYGFLESDSVVVDRLAIPREEACQPAGTASAHRHDP